MPSLAAANVAARFSSLRVFVIVSAVGLVALAPELMTGLTVTDNFRFNLLWPEQFANLFREGQLYPRWLPSSWGGLGSPNFYFYPPLFFWVTALVDQMTGGALPAERFVPLSSLVLLIASGLSMHCWLQSQVSRGPALLGAIAYMLAPYHLYDLYGRGALAEASAYASVPIVMLALARLGEGRSSYLPLLAVGYGALLLSHLPTALLVSLFLIGPYVLFVGGRTSSPFRFITRALAGGALGIGLGAIYLVPAIALLPYVSSQALSGSFYRPESWFFWHLRAGPMAGRMYLIIPICIASALFAAATVMRTRDKREPIFWALLIVILVAIIAGIFPAIWSLPGLKLVQFPWRALLVVEFAVVTMLAMFAPRPSSMFVLAGAATLGFAYVVLGLVASHMVGRTWDRQRQTAAEIRAQRLDAPEYLPAGTRIEQGEGPDDVSVRLPQLPLASAARTDVRIAVAEAKDGGMTIASESPVPTRITVRRAYFPHWRVRDDRGQSVPILPELRTRAVTFAIPAGKSVYRLELGESPYERMARIMTLTAIALLTVIAGMLRLTARPSPPVGARSETDGMPALAGQ